VHDTMTAWQIPRLGSGRLRELGTSQAWLGEQVGEATGQRVSQSAVSSWITGTHQPSPEQVFALERVLGFRPGQLSRHWGYLPLEARSPGGGVEAAIRDDPELASNAKRALVAAYRELKR
jgi:DNA-binding transcriptional regulator YdaS (Cro superfamily)